MSSYNENHKRRLLSTFAVFHNQMADIEAWLNDLSDTSPFSKYINDLSPTEKKVIQEYFARIRAAMLKCLKQRHIALAVSQTRLSWATQLMLTFMRIGLSEIGPARLAGYGTLDEDTKQDLILMQGDLHRLFDRLSAYLRQRPGFDLEDRLKRLANTSVDVGTLSLLDRIIQRWKLLEFRPLLDVIAKRLEAPHFEIAICGRVSCGKSSLLNHIASMDVLPVGVTPVTAVPTRLVRGEKPAAIVSFARRKSMEIEVERIAEFASEEHNRGNYLQVTDILVQLPSARLREGVVLVDTPGIGSLATSGSSETYAYLPRCDLGVVMIDAASTLNGEDLAILRALYERGIEAEILLSKADLLTPADRGRMLKYIAAQVEQELEIRPKVNPVSTVGEHEGLLTQWFEMEIEPLLNRHRAMSEKSLKRKVGHLRESVLTALQTMASQEAGPELNGAAALQTESVKNILKRADAAIGKANAIIQDWTTNHKLNPDAILNKAARVIAATDGPLFNAEERFLSLTEGAALETSQAAHHAVLELQKELGGALSRLEGEVPLTKVDPSSVGDLRFSGLPTPDFAFVAGKMNWTRRCWVGFSPWLKACWLRRRFKKTLEPELFLRASLYESLVKNWVQKSVSKLVDAYEAQAEVFREYLRRLTENGDGTDTAQDREALWLDIDALQKALEHDLIELHEPVNDRSTDSQAKSQAGGRSKPDL